MRVLASVLPKIFSTNKLSVSHNMAPNKLRQIIIGQIEAGKSKVSIARSLGVHIQTVYVANKVYHEHVTTDYNKTPSRPISSARIATREAIKERVEADADVGIHGLAREQTWPN